MPQYLSKNAVKTGLPLGGIGAGKMEILPSGVFNAFTFLNNWSEPIQGNANYPGILGYHLGVSSQPLNPKENSNEKKKSFLLQTVPIGKIPTVRAIHYRGIFPRAELSYDQPLLGLRVTLEAWSSWVPGNAKDSSLPAVFFKFKIKNLRNHPVKASLLFIGRNVCGQWNVGRQNKIIDDAKAVHLEFSNPDPNQNDPRTGELRFSFEKKGWKTTYLEAWNAVTKNFNFNAENLCLQAWDIFEKEGTLPNTSGSSRATGENQELCGAVSASKELSAHGSAEWSWMAAWHFPQHAPGHQYSALFKDAGAVTRYGVAHRKRLEAKVTRIQRLILDMPYPEWFCDALLTSLAPFYSSSWYVRDGRFAFYEAPVVCPLMGTLDVGFYGSIPLAYFFPELEASQISQFAAAQRSDGYIPHDLGKNRLDRPSNGTTFYCWKDLNPKFILMVYRDYQWSKDRKFLTKIYSHVKRALQWSVRPDTSIEGLPAHEGQDQTFDLWDFRGVNSYTASLFLAACLASQQMAKAMGDTSFHSLAERYFRKGRMTFEKELWNGHYFGKDSCLIAQLNGQWAADLLGLGSVADPAMIRKALTTVMRQNSQISKFGMINATGQDGLADASNEHSRNIWSGMNYAFLSLCILRGFPLKNLLPQARKIWDNVVYKQKNAWSQPDTIDAKTGQYVFGDSYYRNMAIWSIPIAEAKRNSKTRRILRALRNFK